MILLDLDMPVVGGMDVCRLLRSKAETESIPIVMLTGNRSEADMVAGLETGADDYLTKPLSADVLVAKVRAVLRRTPRPGPDGRLADEDALPRGYRLLNVVGVGGMGTVYRAVQTSLDRTVAVKVLARDLESDRGFVEGFLREARLLAKLAHPIPADGLLDIHVPATPLCACRPRRANPPG